MRRFPSIKKNWEFLRVYREGRSLSYGCLIMYVLRDKGGMPGSGENKRYRLGISCSKKIGNSVVRHTVSRKLREIFRLSLINHNLNKKSNQNLNQNPNQNKRPGKGFDLDLIKTDEDAKRSADNIYDIKEGENRRKDYKERVEKGDSLDNLDLDLDIAEEIDVVVVVRRGAKDLSYKSLERSFTMLLKRHGLSAY